MRYSNLKSPVSFARQRRWVYVTSLSGDTENSRIKFAGERLQAEHDRFYKYTAVTENKTL